jgi:hypothetical protein
MLQALIKQRIISLIRADKQEILLIFRLIRCLSIVYFCFIVFYIGLKFDSIIRVLIPVQDSIVLINTFLLHYFSAVFLIGIFLKKEQFAATEAYLYLPVKRKTLYSLILITAPFSYLNLILLLLIIPYSVVSILPLYGIGSFIGYLLSIFLILLLISHIILTFNTLKNYSLLYTLVPGIIMVLYFLVFRFFVKPGILAGYFFNGILSGDYTGIIVISILCILSIVINGHIIKELPYRLIEGSNRDNSIAAFELRNSIIGKCNWFIDLEIKLIFRNKRLIHLLIIPIYVLIIYYLLSVSSQGLTGNMLILLHICISGAWGYSYSQYMFSWDSSYSDLIYTLNFDLKKFIQAKYLIMLLSSILLSLFVIPVIIYKGQSILLFFTALLYNISIGYFVVIYTASFNDKRIEINKSLFLNLQGYSIIQVLSIIIVILFPFLLGLIFSELVSTNLFLLVVNIFSLLSLVNNKRWFYLIYKQLSLRKYKNLEGYRK